MECLWSATMDCEPLLWQGLAAIVCGALGVGLLSLWASSRR